MARIGRTDDVIGGEPRIDGTRVSVLDVYELVAADHAPVDVADQLDCTLADVYAALAYYHEHPDEMRDLRRESDALERELADAALSPPRPAK